MTVSSQNAAGRGKGAWILEVNEPLEMRSAGFSALAAKNDISYSGVGGEIAESLLVGIGVVIGGKDKGSVL